MTTPAKQATPGASTTVDPGPRRSARTRRAGWWFPYAVVAPAVVLEIAIHIVPMLGGIGMSFIELTKFYIRRWRDAPFAGAENYRIAVQLDSAVGQELLQSFLLTCAFTVLVVGFSWVFGMAGAVVLQRSFRSRGLWRTLFLVPYALPLYAGIITWNFMLQRDTGAVNHVLGDQLGLVSEAPFWLIGDNAFVSLVTVAVWRMWPFAFLMLTAGLQALPQDVYEASALEGAGPWRQWWSMTLPLLSSVNVVLVLVMFLWVFNDFNTPYVLFGTAQPPAGDLISFHIYNASFLTWDFGVGAAMSVLLLLFLLLVTAVYLLLTRKLRTGHA